MNRGARRDPVFLDDDCCLRFLDLVSQLPARHGMVVHGYAILPNHYHLLLECREGGLSRSIQFLQSAYSRWVNHRFEWDGPLWRGRYASRLVEDDAHWMHLLAYVHLNPVKAGLVPRVEDGRWTSHAAYVGEESPPEWLTTRDLQKAFGSVEAYRTYLHEVRIGREEGPGDPDPDLERWTRTGGTGGPPPERAEPSGKPVWPLDMEAALTALELASGLGRAAILAAPRGRGGNIARTVALWWLPRATGEGQASVARALGTDPALVSRASARVRAGLPAGTPAREWVDRLSALLPGRSVSIDDD
jgi:REP element-mobilizing transposase RayT